MYAAGGASVVTPAALAEFKARHVFGTPDMSVEFEFNFLIERYVPYSSHTLLPLPFISPRSLFLFLFPSFYL